MRLDADEKREASNSLPGWVEFDLNIL